MSTQREEIRRISSVELKKEEKDRKNTTPTEGEARRCSDDNKVECSQKQCSSWKHDTSREEEKSRTQVQKDDIRGEPISNERKRKYEEDSSSTKKSQKNHDQREEGITKDIGPTTGRNETSLSEESLLPIFKVRPAEQKRYELLYLYDARQCNRIEEEKKESKEKK
ncbi:hypothetical protein PROFUN_13975 [Planoprotostelium fungivorum]|uniref:Uncharacterized protein n=1 Tax=Planoprotostelium fungivorum TaxID=1890364 RepID=A0A2P6N2R6_9EUKA|nr:hypothetical protein PROFUN_13975 [Planoprotostelium fungivorum]